MKKIVLLILLLSHGLSRAEDILIIPYETTSLTDAQRHANPTRLIYPATLVGKDSVLMPCEIDSMQGVDLGTGVLWATCNVGAKSPEEYGDFFAWGETQPKDFYWWNTYKYCEGRDGYTLTKYCYDANYGIVDNNNILDPEDDIVQQKWGGKWRMPDRGELAALYRDCTWYNHEIDGVMGFLVVSKINNNYIFLPCAGWKEGDSHFGKGTHLCMFSSSATNGNPNHNPDEVWAIWCEMYKLRSLTGKPRCLGFSIRPVCEK
jgi:hypothetical protein